MKLTAADGDLYGSGVSFLTSRENAPFDAFIGVKIFLDFVITDAPNNATFAKSPPALVPSVRRWLPF